MTKADAKKISLEMWQELAETGKMSKSDSAAWEKYSVIRMLSCCPICESLAKYNKSQNAWIPDCKQCPLGSCTKGSLFCEWNAARRLNVKNRLSHRMAFAAKIVEAIEGWEV